MDLVVAQGIIVDPGVFIGIRCGNIGLQGLDGSWTMPKQLVALLLHWRHFCLRGISTHLHETELEYPMRGRLGCLHNPHYTSSICPWFAPAAQVVVAFHCHLEKTWTKDCLVEPKGMGPTLYLVQVL